MKPIQNFRLAIRQASSRQIILVSLLLFGLVILTIGLINGSSSKNTIDVITEGTTVDVTKQASLSSADKLSTSIGNSLAYDQLTQDIFTFGKSNYNDYKKSVRTIVGFRVNPKSVTKKGSTITFDGRYGSSSNKISVSVQLLKNDRIKTSITDTRTKKNIDKDLPSNSKTNQFLSTLPITYKTSVLTYSNDNFIVKVRIDLNSPSDIGKADVLNFLSSQTSSGYITDDNVVIYYSSNSPSGDHTDYVQVPIVGSNSNADY